MNTPDIIDLAVSIELECAALYEVFGRCFAGRDEVVYFWRIYAEAERYHAASIRIHQAAFSGEQMKGLEIGEIEAAQVLEEIRALRIGFERSPPTITEALRAARQVEESSAELHGRTQFFKLHPHFSELFQKMAEEDRAHRDVLSTAEQRFGA